MNGKRHLEPLFWSLFGAGGMVTALITPVLVLIVGIGVPFGIIPAEALSYDRIVAFAGSWIGRIALSGIIIMTLWHCVHRIYHSLHDFGFPPCNVIKSLFYGSALILSIVTLTMVLLV
ncbi:MAG: fumarate reductase subunit FrdD [Endozoicomonadaceae bacterium]|nr:fumarate reductase subunit FrdD [Endozoicomonadaceae bacterium]